MLYYCKTSNGNFGDFLNSWLWPRLAPELCDEHNPSLFLGIGTVLSYAVPQKPLKFVFGSGWSGNGRLPKIDDKWIFYCVRGPLTATALKLDRSLALTDPAILIRRIPLYTQNKCYPVSLMPHHQSMFKADWNTLCQRSGIHCIDPRSGVEFVISELQKTQLLLSESLHGAIVADVLRVPWIPLQIYSHFCEFKWHDWAESLQVPLHFANLPPVFENNPPWNKRVDYAFKRGLACVHLGMNNWRRLEIRASTQHEIDNTLHLLEKLPNEHPVSLSSEKTLAELEKLLFERLSCVRDTWAHLGHAG
jgi:succinoglycan biosynthesis protein ExoV